MNLIFQSGRISEVLQTVTVPIVDTSTCTASYGDSIKSGMICAGYTGGGRDACQVGQKIQLPSKN